MKKILYVFSALALLFASCSSDGDSTPDDSSSTGLLTQIVETYDDGFIETVDFTYNGNKIVKSTSDFGEETVYTYTGDLITETKSYLDGNLEERITYEYDSNSRLIRSTKYYDNGSVINIDVFTYNANNTVFFTTTFGTETLAEGVIYLSGNQPYKKEITYYPGTIEEHISIEETSFDNKNNPLKTVTGLAKIEIANPYSTVGFGGVFNNPIVFKIDNVTKETSSFTYNNNGYPVSESYDDFENNGNDSTLQYFYN